MSAYSEKLKDPRWQKKRLEVLEARGWECELCQETKKTLHVHHDHYRGDPWDVPEIALFVLCEDCHSLIHKYKVKAIDYSDALNCCGFDEFRRIMEKNIKNMGIDKRINKEEIYALCISSFAQYEEHQRQEWLKEREKDANN